jgi:hypothetical protein
MDNARNTNGTFKEGDVPWNKGSKGVMKAWNKGKRKIPFTTKFCIKCGVEYTRSPKLGNEGWLKRQFCSKSCKSKGNAHNIGRKHSDETREKMRKANPRGELNRNWNPNRDEIKSNKDRHYCAKYI